MQITRASRRNARFYLLATLVALPLAGHAQSRERGERPASPPPTHARRDRVQTRDVPPRTDRAAPPRRPTPPDRPAPVKRVPPLRATPERRSQRSFTRTIQGRRYDNGMPLRPAATVRNDWQRPYFPKGRAFYPYYAPRYEPRTTFLSPFAFYFGVCAPFLSQGHGYDRRPRTVFIETVVYRGDEFRGYTESRETNYFDQSNLGRQEPGLLNAVDELHETFRSGNIDALVALTDPKVEIAIFLKGTYAYSMDASDFLDLTRDALASTKTVQFDLYLLHKRAEGVFAVSGKHVYRDRGGRNRTVYVSYVLESIEGEWTLTQVGTAPDREQAWE